MDTAPTSSTSHKAGELHTPTHTHHRRHRHRHHQRSSSFPASFNPFRKKHRPRDSPNPALNEPYEVAPGIWSNEATAKVFGYLDDNNDVGKWRRGMRSKSAGPDDKRARSRSPSPAKKLVERYREAHADDGTDDFSQRTHRRHTEEGVRRRQERREEARRALEEAEAQTDRGRRMGMRTVSKEDTLVARGANPRTGVVSPSATSESAGSGYMTRGRREESVGWRGRKEGGGVGRSRSGRWLQDSHGWSLVESPALSPIAQSERTVEERRRSSVPVKELQDKFVVNMPSASEPAPLGMSKEQIEEYQRSVERAYRDGGGSHALVDPDTLPAPRLMTPEGPSTPPRRLGKIRRKEVGSAASPRNESTDTVIINGQARAASLPTPRKGQQQQPRVRVVSPGHTVRDVSDLTGERRQQFENQQDPFLEVRKDGRSYRMNATLFPSHPTRHAENHQPDLRSQEDTDAVYYTRQPHSQTLSQYLPPVNLIHPYSASKPKHLSPHRINAISAPPAVFTTTTPITTTTTPHRPSTARVDGSDSVRQANLLQGHLIESRTPKIEFHPACPAAYATGGNLLLGRRQREVIEEPMGQEKSGLPRSLVAGPQGLTGESNTCMYTSTSHPYLRQRTVVLGQSGQTEGLHNNRGGRGGGREPFRPILGNGGIRIEEKPIRGGIVTTNDGRDGELLRMKAMANRRKMMQADVADPNHLWGSEEDAAGSLQVEVGTIGSSADSSDVKVGESADSCMSGITGDERYNRLNEANGSNRASSLVRKIQDVRRVMARLNEDFNASQNARRGIIQLFEMTQHVLSTLNPASPAMKVIKKSDAKLEDYIVAGKDVLLAGLYLLILVNIGLALGKIVEVGKDVVGRVWAPVRVVVVVLRWLTVG